MIPLLGGLLGWVFGAVSTDFSSIADLSARWEYSASTAEAVLAAVVAASVGLVGFVVTVSVLIVQMSTNTFSARYMRIFYRDRAFKAVLAVLIGTFTFSYTLMRHVEENDVPNLGVTVAGAFLGLGILLFVVFLDRAIHRLRPVAVAALVAAAGRKALREVLEEAARPDAPAVVPAPYSPPGEPIRVVRMVRGGAIQAIDFRGLGRWAHENESLVVLRHPIGDFVSGGAVLIELYGRDPGPEAEDRLRSMIALGVERTIEQDPAFAVRIMVDIAIRALSPAVNDPTTAVQVLNHLEDLLRLVGQTDLSDEGTPLEEMDTGLVVPVRRWGDYLTLSVTEIREYGDGSIQVVRRLRAMLDELSESVLPERREAVLRELARLDEAVAAKWGTTVDVDLAGQAGSPGHRRPDGTRRVSLEVLAAELTRDEAQSLVFVFLATTLGAVLSRWHLRLVLPTVVVEIVLGILIGPEVFGLAEIDPYINFLSDFGLALLFFFAGLEVIEHHVPRAALRRGTIGWGMSLAIGLVGRSRPPAGGSGCRVVAARRRLGDNRARHAGADPLRRAHASDAARTSRARYRSGRRVLADHLHLRLPDECLRGADGGRAPPRLRRPYRRRGQGRDAGAPAATPPHPPGHAPHDGTGRCPRVDPAARSARFPRSGRRVRVRPRCVRRRHRGRSRARLTGRARWFAFGSRESASGSSCRSTSSSRG